MVGVSGGLLFLPFNVITVKFPSFLKVTLVHILRFSELSAILQDSVR